MADCGFRRGLRIRQRGQAVLALVLMLGIAVSVFIYNALDPAQATVRREARTQTALREARDALIGRAASDNNRPGSLPCPDTDNDGSAELFAGVDCPSYIGRLPWKTLRLPDLRDGSGERLWYALSNKFRDHVNAEPINSDTKGNITVYQDTTAAVITNEAVAVVFAPGAVLGGQVRDPAGANNSANYLDTVGGINNATPTANAPLAPLPSFIASRPLDTPAPGFNDKLLVVTTADLMPIVERRVANEVIALLKSYKAAVGVYPWSDCSDGESDTGYENRGRISWRTATSSPSGTTLPVDWGSGGAPALPAWYVNNQWSWVIYYAAAKNYLQSSAVPRPPWTPAGIECSTCVNETLSVDGVSGKEVVIIMPGPAGASRPLGTPGTCNPPDWQAYLEDSQNNDVSNDLYVTPTSTAYARDRLFTIP